MFNVQSKTDEVNLVYCTNQTKRLMEKTKKKTFKSSLLSVKAVRWKTKDHKVFKLGVGNDLGISYK